MNRIWKKNHTMILVGILLISIVLYVLLYFTLIKPLHAENATVEQELDMYENIYEKLLAEIQSEDNLDEFSYILEKIPDEKSPESVLYNLNEIAGQSDVAITYVESMDSVLEENELVQKAEYTLEVEAANLLSINNFFNLLINGDRFININSIDLTQLEDNVFVSMTISSFYATN